jgi:hypothetical protein
MKCITLGLSLALVFSSPSVTFASTPVVEFEGTFRSAKMPMDKALKALGSGFVLSRTYVNPCNNLNYFEYSRSIGKYYTIYGIGNNKEGAKKADGTPRNATFFGYFQTDNPRNTLTTGLHVGSKMKDIAKAYGGRIETTDQSQVITINDANGQAKFYGYKGRVSVIRLVDRSSICNIEEDND